MKMFETRIQTYWDDADPAGRVYYAHFFRFVDCAEIELFRVSGVENEALRRIRRLDAARRSVCEVPNPIRAEERFCSAAHAVQRREDRAYGIRDCFHVDRSLLAEGVTAVCMDRQSSRSRPRRPPYERFLRGLRRTVTVDNEY